MSTSQLLVHASISWAEFVGLSILVGGLVFRHLIVRPLLASRQEIDRFEQSLWWVLDGSIVLVALASVGELILRTLVLSQGSLGDLGVALPVVLLRTHYGAVWIVRIGLLGLLVLFWLLGRPATSHASLPAWALLAGAILVALTTSLSGHAADWGDVRLPVLVDWLHLLVISVWSGGLFTFGFVFCTSVSCPDKMGNMRDLSALAARFSRMAACCAVVFLGTGLYNAWTQVASLSPLVTTSYGRAFLVKLSLVALVLMNAALNRYYFLPLLKRGARAGDRLRLSTPGRLLATLFARKRPLDGERIRRQFVRSLRLEWIIAAGILACTALLTQLPPARHIRRHQHREQHALHQQEHGDAAATWSPVGRQRVGKFPLDRARRPW